MEKARGTIVRSRVTWKQVGNKWLAEFFKSLRQKNSMSVILELKDDHRRVFTKREDFDRICYDLQLKLYNHRDISVEALREVYEGFLSHLLRL